MADSAAEASSETPLWHWLRVEYGVEVNAAMKQQCAAMVSSTPIEALKPNILDTLLSSDLRKIVATPSKESFANILKDLKASAVTFFKGPLLTQVLDTRDITKSQKSSTISEDADEYSLDTEDGHTMQLLMHRLNDGRSTFKAMEYERCKGLGINTKPGTKIVLGKTHALPIRNSVLLLQPNCVDVLGGEITRLVEAKEAKLNVQRQLYQVPFSEGDSGPPKFESFPTPSIVEEFKAKSFEQNVQNSGKKPQRHPRIDFTERKQASASTYRFNQEQENKEKMVKASSRREYKKQQPKHTSTPRDGEMRKHDTSRDWKKPPSDFI